MGTDNMYVMPKKYVRLLRRVYNQIGRRPFTIKELKEKGLDNTGKEYQGKVQGMLRNKCLKITGKKLVKEKRGYREIRVYKITREMADYLEENPISETTE